MRFKVFVSALFILAVISGVLFLKMDSWLTHKIENDISAITHTKTNISDLKFSILDHRLSIKKLEIASKDDEFKNDVTLGDLSIGFEFSPLLQKRLVVREVSVQNILLGSSRSTSGKMTESNAEATNEKSLAAIETLKTSTGSFNKVLDFEVPSDPTEVMSSLNLKSLEAYQNSISNLEQYRSEISSRFSELQNPTEYDQRMHEVRALASKEAHQNLSEVKEEIQKTSEYFQNEKRKAESLYGDIMSDIRKSESDLAVAGNVFQMDVSAAKNKVGIEGVDVGNLSKIIFGPFWLDRAELALRYHALLRKSLIASTESDGSVQVEKSSSGRDITFIDEQVHPAIILENSHIVSKSSSGESTAAYDITLKGLNSSPELYGKESSLEMHASFQNSFTNEAIFRALWDYSKAIPKDEFQLELAHLKLDQAMIGIPKIFPIKLAKGVAHVESKLNFDNNKMNWQSEVSFSDLVWDLSELPQAGKLMSPIQDTFTQTKNFHLSVEMKSNEKDAEYTVKSDLDEKLKLAIELAVQKKIIDVQDKVALLVEDKVFAYRDQATKRINELRTDTLNSIKSRMEMSSRYSDEVGKLEGSLNQSAQSKSNLKSE